MKFLITLSFTLSLASLAWTSDAIWGKRKCYQYTLYTESVVIGPEIDDHINYNVGYNIDNSERNNRTIKAVVVFDKFDAKSGAEATLLKGGPGFNFASLNLRSQYSKGIDTFVGIYGN